MNYSGSFRKLVGNAKAAMMAAIEIYNKPTFSYRDECSVILLLNAWELFLKAVLSKNGKSVYYPKKRKQPYKTLSWQDAFTKATVFFPRQIGAIAILRNLELLGTYRDNAVHFYNAGDFEVLIHALAQTSVKNFRDLLEHQFGQRLEDEINWRLLPIGIEPPVDVITYLRGTGTATRNSAVRQFLAELAAAKSEVSAAGADTGRLMTIFNVKLESVKKIGDAEVVVGVGAAAADEGPLIVVRSQDPNKSHPLRQKEIVGKLETLHDQPFTTYVFQAIAWKYDLKSKPQYCWQATEGVLTKYSNDVVAFVKSLSGAQVKQALADYRQHIKATSKSRKAA